jgi:hypothetical protein
MSKVADVTNLCVQSLHKLILVRSRRLFVCAGSSLNRADNDATISARTNFGETVISLIVP